MKNFPQYLSILAHILSLFLFFAFWWMVWSFALNFLAAFLSSTWYRHLLFKKKKNYRLFQGCLEKFNEVVAAHHCIVSKNSFHWSFWFFFFLFWLRHTYIPRHFFGLNNHRIIKTSHCGLPEPTHVLCWRQTSFALVLFTFVIFSVFFFFFYHSQRTKQRTVVEPHMAFVCKLKYLGCAIT